MGIKLAAGPQHIERPDCAIVTAGTFDGVHLGHQKILARLKELARDRQGQTVLITYEPHPRLVLGTTHDVKLLTSLEEKARLLERQGIDQLVVLPFTKEFAAQPADAFIKDVLIEKINTRVLVIGYDHRFGHNREGSFEHLQANAARYGFEVQEIPRQDVEDVAVSSTKIRLALEQGRLQDANQFLGRPYSIQGTVVHGRQLGRTIGFATANIQLPDPHKLVPLHGVYAVIAQLDGHAYNGVMNIGIRPTVSGVGISLEVHLLDFSGDIYGRTLNVHLLKYLRQEMKFAHLDDLQQQIALDAQAARHYLHTAEAERLRAQVG